MPTYNSADFVEESIESILSQTYTNWELIITDDIPQMAEAQGMSYAQLCEKIIEVSMKKYRK